MKPRFVVDNKMRDFADYDPDKAVIRINKNMAQKKRRKKAKGFTGHAKYPELLDSIVHEKMHHDHPHLTEHMVRHKTKEKIKSMHPNEKRMMYSKLK